jgi:4-hydroxy-3-methylbut-2-enyl diphosphate reductase
MKMKILRATHMGMCFGVRDAIALALGQTEPATILGDLVHNDTVLQQLRSQGVSLQQQVAEVSTQHVIITAHGASQRRLNEVRARGHTVIEATCPLVHSAHRALSGLVASGYHPVIIGRRDHVEVRGMTEDLEVYDVVLEDADLDHLAARPRFGVVAQTTQPIERVRQLVQRLRERFPGAEVRFIDTVCQPTKLRQNAAEELARQCDVVLVIGGAHSNNTRELAATCRRHCERVHHVQTAADLHATWLNNARTIGITAGTSTPDTVIDAVEQWLHEFARFQEQIEPASAKESPRPPSSSAIPEPAPTAPVVTGFTAPPPGSPAAPFPTAQAKG